MRLRRGRLIVGTLVVLALLAIGAWLTYRSKRADRPETAAAAPPPPTSQLGWDIHHAMHEVLPAGGYSLLFQESKRCNGASVVKQGGLDWKLGIAWYDKKTQQVTDVIKREELVELLSQYFEVERAGLWGVRHAQEDQSLEMFLGDSLSSGENVWLQLDPDSCGVRSGWLVHRGIFTGKVTRQRITW